MYFITYFVNVGKSSLFSLKFSMLFRTSQVLLFNQTQVISSQVLFLWIHSNPLHLLLALTEMAISLRVPRKLCSISLFLLFLPLFPQEILGFITYSREELLDIRARSTHQHYEQEYDFTEADPLFGPPPRTIDRIPAGKPKQQHRRRGERSGLLVSLRRRAHRAHPFLLLNFVAPSLQIETKTGSARAQICSTQVRPIVFHASRLL